MPSAPGSRTRASQATASPSPPTSSGSNSMPLPPRPKLCSRPNTTSMSMRPRAASRLRATSKSRCYSWSGLWVPNRSPTDTPRYHVPVNVQEHIDYVQPGLRLMAGGRAQAASAKKRADNSIEARGFRTNSKSKFSGPIFGKTLAKSALPSASSLSMCDSMITPACIMAMYNITAPTKASKDNQLGIFEEGDFYAAEDLLEFFTLFAPNIPPTTEPTLDGIDGGFAPSAYAGGESDLDFQISYPIIYPQQEILYQTDDLFYSAGLEGGGGFLNTFFDAIDGSYCTFSAYGETGDASIDPYVSPHPIALAYLLNLALACTPTRSRLDTRARASAASTSLQMSSPSRTASRKTTCRRTTNSGSALK